MVVGGLSKTQEIKDSNPNICSMNKNDNCAADVSLIHSVEFLGLSSADNECLEFLDTFPVRPMVNPWVNQKLFRYALRSSQIFFY